MYCAKEQGRNRYAMFTRDLRSKADNRLKLQGIDSVILEARTRDYVEARVRAGVLEPGPIWSWKFAVKLSIAAPLSKSFKTKEFGPRLVSLGRSSNTEFVTSGKRFPAASAT